MIIIHKHPSQLVIGIKGAGEMASGVTVRLYKANIRKIFMMEVPSPLAVRRTVSFCEAVFKKKQTVENVTAVNTESVNEIFKAWKNGQIAVSSDPDWELVTAIKPDVVIDATLAKKNLGTHMGEAPLVIGLGPGFEAGKDVHCVIETLRGHDLGRVIYQGTAVPNTGIPGVIAGFSTERVLRAPCDGEFKVDLEIGDEIIPGQRIGCVGETSLISQIGGVLRGLICPGATVNKGMKIGDVDPRGVKAYCHRVSEKARAIGGGVLEGVLNALKPSSLPLFQVLGISRNSLVSLVGAGGKTSLMFLLAQELEKAGKKVLTTTTTKIFFPDKQQSKISITAVTKEELILKCKDELNRTRHLTAGFQVDESTNKLVGLLPDWIDQIRHEKLFDVILVETDGSRQKPIKASADHEPVIPQSTTHLAHVTGLDALYGKIDNSTVHRPEIMAANFELEIGQPITPDVVAANINFELRKAESKALSICNIVILNKAEQPSDRLKGYEIIELLNKDADIHHIILTSTRDTYPLKYHIKQTAWNNI